VSAEAERRGGIAYGVAAYLWWGMAAIYFKWIDHVPPLEILAHRVIWSAVLLILLLAHRRRLGEALHTVTRPRTLRTLVATTALIALNWFTFIWAVTHGQLLQASLGYFITPLVNVLLGMVVLRERLRRPQALAVILAAAAVLWLAVGYGEPPRIALVLAFCFGFYGLLRKQVAADALTGLSAETVLLLPLAAGWLLLQQSRGGLVFGHLDRSTDLLLTAAGGITALPLLWFAHAARRLPYSTVGFLQYLAPSFQFLLAVLVFDEPLAAAQLGSFAVIWAALGLFSWDLARRRAAVRVTRP
jgi:chloramphenicol-sensitive protein RarD